MKRKVTRAKMRVLESLIYRVKRVNPLALKAVIWLLRQSNGLTEEVFFELHSSMGRRIALGIHSLVSSNGTTHVNDLLELAGSEMVLSSSSGDSPHDHGKVFLGRALYVRGIKKTPSISEIRAVTV